MATKTFKTTNTPDVFLESDDPTGNQNDTRLIIGELTLGAIVTRSVIKFSDLDNGVDIPAGSTINSAKLRLYKLTDYSSNNRTASVYRLLRSFVETQATWNKADSGTNWGTAGADNTSNDREASAIGTRAYTSGEGVNAFAEFDLDPAKIQEMIAGGVFTNNGFVIRMATESEDGWSHASSNHGTSANHPELVIDYTAPPPANAGNVIIF